jgi:hypothetical protein
VNVSYSEKLGFVWYRIAKTGTRTLHQVLSESVEDYVYVVSKTATQRQKEAIASLVRSGAFSFSCVRNPWERLVSAWYDKFKRAYIDKDWLSRRLRRCELLDSNVPAQTIIDADFPFFVAALTDSELFKRDPHFMLQSRLLPAHELTYLARFEHYERDVFEILRRLKLPRVSILPRINATPKRDQRFHNYFSLKERATVATLYADDIDQFGYTFE